MELVRLMSCLTLVFFDEEVTGFTDCDFVVCTSHAHGYGISIRIQSDFMFVLLVYERIHNIRKTASKPIYLVAFQSMLTCLVACLNVNRLCLCCISSFTVINSAYSASPLVPSFTHSIFLQLVARFHQFKIHPESTLS